MIRAERIEMIRSLSKEQDIITWEDLQSHLKVSKATVRRDVSFLCQEGILEKTRGGVIFLQSTDSKEPSNSARELKNMEAKQKIAAAALDYIQEDDFVMLDSGSTVTELARRIPEHIRLTVVTYAISALNILDSKPNVDLYFTGGKLRKQFPACHGYFAENMLKEFHAGTCFLGADSISLEDGVMGYNMYDVRLKQIMIANSKQVVLLADHSKFTNTAFIHIAPLEQIDVIITDAELDKSYLKALRELGIKVIQTS